MILSRKMFQVFRPFKKEQDAVNKRDAIITDQNGKSAAEQQYGKKHLNVDELQFYQQNDGCPVSTCATCRRSSSLSFT